MADVTGSLGDQPIILNNAATEATLKLLLAAINTQGQATQASIRGLLRGSNLDPQLVERQNDAIKTGTTVSGSLFTTFSMVGQAAGYTASVLQTAAAGLQNLANQSGKPSDVFSTMGNVLPGIFGNAAKLGAEILKISESWLSAYRQMSDTGVNFSGSLSEMRLAATNAYMPLEKFATVVNNNSRVLAQMGMTASDGARAFSHAAKVFIDSPVGTSLTALGYKTEDLGEHMLNYIAMTGGRSQSEMRNTAALSKSTAEYLGHLDALAQITGVSRRQQEEEMKKTAMNAAFQRKMQTLSTEEQNKMMAVLAAASATGIEGATDAVMTEFLGLPPVMESVRNVAGFLPDFFAQIQGMVGSAQDTATNFEQLKGQGADLFMAARQGAERIGPEVASVLILQGNRVMTGAQTLTNQMNKKGFDEQAKITEAFRKVQNDQGNIQQSEAAKAAQAEKAVREAMNAAMQALVPLISTASQFLQNFVIKMADAIKYIASTPTVLQGLWTATKVLTAAFLIFRGALLLGAAGGAIGDIFDRRRTGGTPGGGRPGGGTPTPGGGRPPAPTPAPAPAGGGRAALVGRLLGMLLGGGIVAGGLLYAGSASATERDEIEQREKELARKVTADRATEEEKEELKAIAEAKALANFGMSDEDKARLTAAERVYKSMESSVNPEQAEKDRQDEERRHAELVAQMKKQSENMEKAVAALRDLNPNLFK